MANRTEVGLSIIAGQCAVAGHRALGDPWRMGLPVPYPVQLDGTELPLDGESLADELVGRALGR